jgi:hypothetical protein
MTPATKEVWLAVVSLDDPRIGGGPGTVVEVTCDSIKEALARHTDRDGARSERLRLWLAWPGCEVGDRAVLQDVSTFVTRAS